VTEATIPVTGAGDDHFAAAREACDDRANGYLSVSSSTCLMLDPEVFTLRRDHAAVGKTSHLEVAPLGRGKKPRNLLLH
jgi:hypothetical protein